MDSLAYSELVVEFGRGLMRIAEGAEAAADHDLEGEERTQAIDAGRAKLARYEEIVAMLEQDSKVLQGQFIKRFAMSIDLLRESLAKIDVK